MKGCKNCGTPLDALHMGDIDPELCIECETKIMDSLSKDIELPSLVLWERGITNSMINNEA